MHGRSYDFGGIVLTAGELCRVLIVDDEILIRQGIKHYLNWEREGFEIVGEASNGQEALESIETLRPHIIITDIVMPIMDGEQLTRTVKARYPDIEVIVLSSFGEFDYVRSTFQSGVADYILKPKLEAQGLLDTLKSAAGRIPSLQFTEQANGSEPSLSQMIDRLVNGFETVYDTETVTQTFPYKRFCLLAADFDNPAAEEGTESHRLEDKLERSFHERAGRVVCHAFPAGGHSLVIVLNFEEANPDNLISAARDIADCAPEAAFALSEPFGEFSKLGAVYKESRKLLLRYRFYFPDRRLVIPRELPIPEPKCESFNLEKFTAEIKRERFEAAFGYLQEHVAVLSGCYTNDAFTFKSFLSNIIFNVTVLLGNMNYDTKDLDDAKYAYFKAIDQARHARQAAGHLNRFIKEAEQCIASGNSQTGNPNMRKLLDYIDQHYAEPLTLTEVAKHFHFNPSYLSSYFAAHNKEGFIEYLNSVRIAKASELLVKDNAYISEIGGMVGYSDHSYFCKVFKKITGLSPSQYRRKQLSR
ncbi:response regulator transcription factor [uncultured Paenibacillus sp.]|uniref:response regulator transcription factor n=1 Tax=uncultured Paenibacillus sp. TaxID=227322 RepID=UPI0028D29E13|nr:response regulator transcription factor [uncultured Paenibacillus sp.]